jgi:hypothetical protein
MKFVKEGTGVEISDGNITVLLMSWRIHDCHSSGDLKLAFVMLSMRMISFFVENQPFYHFSAFISQ